MISLVDVGVYIGGFVWDFMGSRVLDCTGAKCAVLAVKTRKALDELVKGERIEIISDDVAALSDVKSLAGRLGFEVVSSEKTEKQVRVVLEKD